MPVRLQRKRVKGYRLPPDAVYVGRGTRWGNPATVGAAMDQGVAATEAEGRAAVVRFFRSWLLGEERGDQDVYWLHGRPYDRRWMREHLGDLAGRDLVCWCPLDQPCHADVLIELANRVS